MDGSVNGSVSGQMHFGGDGSVVTVTTKQHTGVNIVDIVVDGVTYHVYAPEPNSITISDLLTEGTKIGRITLNGVNYDIYAPTGGGGSDVSVIPLLDQGTEIACITVDGNTAHIFAPTPQNVSAAAQYNTGTLVGSINISGNITYFYIPDYGADITALDGRLGTAEDNITALTGRVGTAEDNITALTGRVGTAEDNITALTGRVGTAEGNITSLGNRMGTAEGNITNLAGRMTEAETDITALGLECDAIAADLAAPYDEESTYNVGEYCTHNKVLYRCNTTISTAEEWDSTHWDAVKVTDDIIEINSALSAKGYYTLLNGVSVSNTREAKTLHGSRKLSDYPLYLAFVRVGSGLRASMMLPKTMFQYGSDQISLFYVDAANTQRWFEITWKSDTEVYVQSSSNVANSTTIWLFGILV